MAHNDHDTRNLIALETPLGLMPSYETRTPSVPGCRSDVTFLVAQTRGFCHGVDRALRIAADAVRRFSDRRIFLASSIIHNPSVNDGMRALGVVFLDDAPDRWDDLRRGDVVLIPAFGVAPRVRERMERSGALVVDTTCGSVVFVWKSVDRFVRDGYTVAYHGRRGHEEAEATLGRLDAGPARAPHPWILVENRAEGDALARWIEGESSEAELRAALPHGFSPGFSLDRDLDRIGFANQTTMLARDSLAIAARLSRAQANRFPDTRGDAHFRLQDTICSATDERQDALAALIDEVPDLFLIVGGFTSSNTSHLTAMAIDAGFPAFHVESAADLRSCDAVRHRDPRLGRIVESRDWLPTGPVRIGVSSGASTPEPVLDGVLDRVAELAGR